MTKQIENFIPLNLAEVEQYVLNQDLKKKNPDYWLVYSPDIFALINDYAAAGNYPYNFDIENLVYQKLLPQMEYIPRQGFEGNSIFAHIVYNTQCYRHAVEKEKATIVFAAQMKEQGFIPATSEILKDAADTKKRFYVVMKTTDFLGGEGKKVMGQKFKLNAQSWGDKGAHWMNVRASRKGWKAQVGQYIQEAI